MSFLATEAKRETLFLIFSGAWSSVRHWLEVCSRKKTFTEITTNVNESIHSNKIIWVLPTCVHFIRPRWNPKTGKIRLVWSRVIWPDGKLPGVTASRENPMGGGVGELRKSGKFPLHTAPHFYVDVWCTSFPYLKHFSDNPLHSWKNPESLP